MQQITIEYSGLKWLMDRSTERLSELHLLLETPGLDMETTILARGMIQEVRRCIQDAERAYQMGGVEAKWDTDSL